ncbi:MAG: TonB-dependent receptor, partial [Candidatus Eremiobacteraeota bacterium]|nr:TonB-dependent receptor [Candidatus Eremiobacteraeota bacterium]
MRGTAGVFFCRMTSAVALAAVLLTTSTVPARAAGGVTGGLRGTVVDTATGTPLRDATVAVAAPSGRFDTKTDAHGFFSFLQLPADTYTVSVERTGYAPVVIAGVTVLGDQTQSLGTIRIAAALQKIGGTRTTTARATSAFQPNQTVDVTTFSGQRVDQALGETGSTDYNKLVQSAPGVIKTVSGSQNAFSIRGSASVEIGFQFDGLDMRGSFFDENPNQGFLNGVGAGRGSVQVVSGAGDATQGGIGAGVVNVVPGRGSYPGDGFASFDVGSPWFDHAFALQYGTGTKDGRISEFFSARSSRTAPRYAPYGRDAADAGQYFGTALTYDDDVLNNFYYRFGHNNEQQIQVLVDYIDHRQYGNYGGLNGVNFYPYSSYASSQFNTTNFGCLVNPATGNCDSQAWFRAVVPYYQGVPRTNSPFDPPPTPLFPEEYDYGPNNILKIGYTRPLGTNTALNAFFYNWGGLNNTSIVGDSQDLMKYGPYLGFDNSGGRRVGVQTQVTAQAGEKHVLTFVGKYENSKPYWDQMSFSNTFVAFNSTVGPTISPSFQDWYLPQTPGQPVSA